MKDEVSHQIHSAFVLRERRVRRDCGCSAAVLNPADSPYVQRRIAKRGEDAGLCCSPGSLRPTF